MLIDPNSSRSRLCMRKPKNPSYIIQLTNVTDEKLYKVNSIFIFCFFSTSLVVISYISSSLTLKAKREINFYVFQNKLETLNYYPIDTCRKQMCNWSVCVAIISFQGQGKVFRVFPRHKPRHKFPTYCKSDWTLLMVYTKTFGKIETVNKAFLF